MKQFYFEFLPNLSLGANGLDTSNDNFGLRWNTFDSGQVETAILRSNIQDNNVTRRTILNPTTKYYLKKGI